MSNEPVSSSPTPPAVAANVDKTVAIVAYLHLIGLIVAIVINNGDKKNALGSFHLRQSLGIMLTSIVLCPILILPIIGWLAYIVIVIGLWIMGLIGAASGKMTPVPVVGPLFQKWFGSAFN